MKSQIAMRVEAGVWAIALIALAFAPVNPAHHVSLCPLAALNFSFCPGCGLGRSITLFLHGQITASLAMHPLGILAVILLVMRIITLISKVQKFK
jgi:hypothetical protein